MIGIGMEEITDTGCSDIDDLPEQALPTGTTLLNGKFRIDAQIGSGGFGITYLAKDIYLDRDVVIKECFPESLCSRFGAQVHVTTSRNEEQHRKTVEMFMLEARSIAKLRHPNIVGVHQVFEENKTAYMVLDRIHGRDLLDIIEDDTELLSADQVREILVKTLDAIDLIHSNDLLHRDISPDNILLDKWGSPSLIDFGAAREDASKKSSDVSMMLVVKDGYSPHEFYIAGGKQEPCSDLYALGATIYHLISGEAPTNSQVRLAAVAGNDPDPYIPLSGRFSQFDSAFLEAIDKSLSVRPKDRISSAKAWLGLIQTESAKVKTVNIPDVKNVRQSLGELISETNKHVFTAPPKPRAEPEQPVAVVQQETFRPAWLEEFNRETTEAELGLQEQGRSGKKARRLAKDDQDADADPETRKVRRQAQASFALSPRFFLDWVSLSRSS